MLMPTTSTIKDKTFLFTGTLTEFTRHDAEELVKANGGKVLSGVTAKLNFLVVGSDAGSKLTKAQQLGSVKILTEKQFLKLLSTDKPSKKTSVKKKVSKKAVVKPVKDERFSSLSLGSTENQITNYLDSDGVDFTIVRQYVQSGVLSEKQYKSVFEEGGPLSTDPDDRSYLDFFQTFNPEVLFILYREPYEGTIKLLFGQDPSEAIYENEGEEFGRLYRNLHLNLDRSQRGLIVSLKREHYYDYDNIDVDDDLMKEIEQVEQDDKADKTWDTFSIDYDDEMTLEEFKSLFYAHYKEDDIWL
jgi:hypothetical protein